MTEPKQILGQDSQVHRFEAQEQAFELSLALIQQAQRSACLFSRDLDKGFYDREAMVDALSRLARRNRFTEVQILITDPKPLIGQSHALLTLAERLPSKVILRVMHPDYPNPNSSFMLVDDTGLMFRKDSSVYQGFVCFNDPGRCKQFDHDFRAIWQRATQSPELRRLSL